jgi:uncharacterized membrane protein YfcA
VNWYEPPLIIAIGFLAAFLNTIGGGGSLFSVPILTFIGLPITMANATSRVGILFQNIFASTGFRSKGVELPFPYAIYLGLASLGGGLVGSFLASEISDDIFRKIFVIIMLVSVGLILFDPFKSTGKENLTPRAQWIGGFLFLFIGAYGGFAQAGIGFLVIATLSLVNKLSLVRCNYVKVFAAIVYTAVSVLVFAWQDKINWGIGMLLAVGHSMGGWYASRWSVKAGEVWIKRIMIVTVIGMAIALWFT